MAPRHLSTMTIARPTLGILECHSIKMLSLFWSLTVYCSAESSYDACHSIECHSERRDYTDCHSEKRHYTDCHSERRHYTDCHSYECRSSENCSSDYHSFECHSSECHWAKCGS